MIRNFFLGTLIILSLHAGNTLAQSPDIALQKQMPAAT